MPAKAALATIDSPSSSPLETLVANVTCLLSLPDAAVRLNELLADPDATNAEIADVVTMDFGLAARVLRAVNSAAFGLQRQVETISKAIVMIGTSELHSLVLAASAAQAFGKISTKLIDMESFWEHSVRTALVARGLAGSSLKRHRERIFLSALMHDIGKLVICHEVPDLSTRILEAVRMGEAQERVEETSLGFTHADVGALLLERWNLPASLVVPVRFHHFYNEAVEFRQETALLHVANKIAHAMDSDGAVVEPSTLDVAEEAWEEAGCSPAGIERVVAEVDLHWFQVMEIVAPSSTMLY